MPLATIDHIRAVKLFHALSDDTRLGIIEELRSGEQCVCGLQNDLDAARSRLSFHLRVLDEAGLVAEPKGGSLVVIQHRARRTHRGARSRRRHAALEAEGAGSRQRSLLRLNAIA